MANRALACALERLAPFYREQMVGALARAPPIRRKATAALSKPSAMP